MKPIRTRSSRVLHLAVAGLLAAPTATLAEHAWGSYHWARSGEPKTLAVGDNCNSTWDPYLDEAIHDWNVATNELELTEVPGGTRPKTCKATSGRIEVCNERYGNNGWLGIAQIWVSGGHIVQAVAKMNDSYFNSPPYNTAPWRRLVMCQEVAHDFGLAHQDETFNNPNLGSCMDYTNDPDGGAGGAVNNDPSNEHPDGHDSAQLADIYGHLESPGTVQTVQIDRGRAAILDQLDLNSPGAWGRLVAASRGGGIEVYELDLGSGNKHITVVTWTLEAAATRRAEAGHDDH